MIDRAPGIRSNFTPSLMSEADLESLFVAREPLLQMVTTRIAEARDGDARAHLAFTGPRGAGKTHLMSLSYHRARRMDGFGTRFGISWLPEDPWLIDSADELLGAIVEHSEPPIASDAIPEHAIAQWAHTHGPVIVLVENFDQILDAIGSAGQRRFRAFLENSRSVVLFATSTRLSRATSSSPESQTSPTHRQDSPFYGYLNEVPLKPFTTIEAQQMLAAIARRDENGELAHILESPRGRSRLSVIEHLAGGQPRVWALLATGLSAGALDDLVTPLIEKFDDLTPYYQAQLANLSPHERKIVRALSRADHPLSVKAISEATGIGQKSAARTVLDLKTKGWTTPYDGPLREYLDRRLQLYELAEPMARLVFQIKESRGEPIQLAVDFLTAWFDPDELTRAPASALASHYVDAAVRQGRPALELARDWSESIMAVDALSRPGRSSSFARLILDVDDALTLLSLGDSRRALELPRPVSRVVEESLGQSSLGLLRLKLLSLSYSGAAETVRRAESALDEVWESERFDALGYACVVYSAAGLNDPAVEIANRLLTEKTWVPAYVIERTLILTSAIPGAVAADILLDGLITRYRRAAMPPDMLARRHREIAETWNEEGLHPLERDIRSSVLSNAYLEVMYLIVALTARDGSGRKRGRDRLESRTAATSYRDAIAEVVARAPRFTGDASARVAVRAITLALDLTPDDTWLASLPATMR